MKMNKYSANLHPPPDQSCQSHQHDNTTHSPPNLRSQSGVTPAPTTAILDLLIYNSATGRGSIYRNGCRLRRHYECGIHNRPI